MNALFKLDKRISWQWGLLNIAMDYDISFTGDLKDRIVSQVWFCPKANEQRLQQVISSNAMISLAIRPFERIILFLMILSFVSFLGVESQE